MLGEKSIKRSNERLYAYSCAIGGAQGMACRHGKSAFYAAVLDSRAGRQHHLRGYRRGQAWATSSTFAGHASRLDASLRSNALRPIEFGMAAAERSACARRRLTTKPVKASRGTAS